MTAPDPALVELLDAHQRVAWHSVMGHRGIACTCDHEMALTSHVAHLASVLADYIAAREAAVLREVNEVCDRLCWGDFLGADGKRHYGAGLHPADPLTSKTTGFRDWLTDRADRIHPDTTGGE